MKKSKRGIILIFSILISLVFGAAVLANPIFDERSNERSDDRIAYLQDKIDDRIASLQDRIADRASYLQDEIIVKFDGDSEPFRVIKVPAGKISEEIAKYKQRADVVYSEPNYVAYALMTPNDPYYSYQWHLNNSQYGGINIEAAWDVANGAGVTVAVVDTGIAYENYGRYCQSPDLAQTCFVQGYDFVSNNSHPNDDNNHGTHVAGTIAQSTNNNLGVAGTAFNSCLMPVKVLDRYGSGSYSNVAKGIRYAADNGAKVINLSLGGTASSDTLRDAVKYAYEKGVTVVAACGNENSNSCLYPAAYDDYVIAVGATQYDEQKAPYSNYGKNLDIVAPGGNTSIDQNNDGYGDGVLQQTFSSSRYQFCNFGYYFFQGTSMAAPHVSGVAALLISNGNVATPDEVRAVLQNTAKDLGTAGWDQTFGYGLVDAYAALNWTSGLADNPPTVNITSPLNGATFSGSIDITANATDDIGVAQVDFYVGATLIGTDTASPYSVSWDSTTVTDGAYTLTATAIDSASQATSHSVNVTVDNVNNPPVANAGPDQSVYVGDSVTFNGSGSYDSDGQIVSYEWDFGDGVSGSGITVSHIYLSVGNYNVTLMVTDNEGLTNSDTAAVSISEKPAAEICWSGSNEYLYRNSNQARKFCKCAQGVYGYNSYNYYWGRRTVYKYTDTGNNDNWGTRSVFSTAIYRVTCTDGNTYLTNQDYYYNK